MKPVFGKRVDVPGGRRRAPREPILLSASAVTLEDYRPVVIENVCASGAKLRGRNLPPVGAQVLVKTPRQEVLANVAWVRAETCGINFDVPLDERNVASLKDEGCVANLMGVGEAGATGARYRLTF